MVRRCQGRAHGHLPIQLRRAALICLEPTAIELRSRFEASSNGSGSGLVEEDVLPGAGAKGEGVAGAKLVVARGGDLGVVDVRAIA